MNEAMKDDGCLLNEYAGTGSEDAFRELVSRHAGLVFSAARRQVGSDALAEEVAQAVFCILARKANSLRSRSTIAGWLHLTTRHTAMKAVRTELRRQTRENEAMQMNQDAADSTWTELEPHLDQAMAQLRDSDRDLLILRYIEGLELNVLGSRLSISGKTAHKRVSRALERLRSLLAKRGITVSAGMIAAILPARAISPLPDGAMTSLLATGASASSATTLQLINETMNHLFWIKLKTALPVATICVAAVGAPLALQHQTINDLRAKNLQLATVLEQQGETDDGPTPAVEPPPSDQTSGEIHRLRAEITRLKGESAAHAKELEASRSKMLTLQAELQATAVRRDKAEGFIADMKEQGAIAHRINERKLLGVAYDRALKKGVLVRTFDELVEAGGLPKKSREKLRAQTVFFDNGEQTDDPARRMILADREPMQKRDGSQIWFVTFMDSSVQMSTQAPPADGVYRTGMGIANLD